MAICDDRLADNDPVMDHEIYSILGLSPEATCPTDLINILCLVTGDDMHLNNVHEQQQHDSLGHGLIIRDTCVLALSIGLDAVKQNISSLTVFTAGRCRPAQNHVHC